MRKFLLAILLCPCFAFPIAKPGFFNKFPNRYFVETGAYEGEGIANAIHAQFSEIHSIELSDQYYEQCKRRFADQPNVHLWLGDSGSLLEQVIAGIKEPITFWLDAHWSDGTNERSESNTPILKELETIQRHPIKTHTILIDDVRLFGKWEFDEIQLRTITEKIYEINPKYVITYGDGHCSRDILIAEVR